jgi:hypothetical protein
MIMKLKKRPVPTVAVDPVKKNQYPDSIASNDRMMNNELERIWEEAIVASSWHYLGVCLKVFRKSTKTSVNIPAEIRTERLPNTGLERYHNINPPGVYSFNLICFPCDEY